MEGGQQFFVSVEDDAFNSLTSITAYVASDKDRAYDRNQAVEGPNDENFASNRAIWTRERVWDTKRQVRSEYAPCHTKISRRHTHFKARDTLLVSTMATNAGAKWYDYLQISVSDSQCHDWRVIELHSYIGNLSFQVHAMSSCTYSASSSCLEGIQKILVDVERRTSTSGCRCLWLICCQWCASTNQSDHRS